MTKPAKWIIGILLAFFFFVGLFLLTLYAWLFTGPEDESASTYGEKIALVELNEPIFSSENVVRQFKKYRENKSVKAIVFRVESPGGGVSASQEIFEEVKKAREAKPVVVSMGSVAASGGYYVSLGATRIVANPGTVTGSIGVIFQFFHVNELLKKIGIDASTFKSGKFKDAGSPFRKPTEDEKKYFGELIGDVYDQFVGAVATERKMTRAKVLRYADGRIFTGRMALEYGFVDTLGTLEDAISIAGELGSIKGKPKVVRELKVRPFLDRLLGEAATDLANLRDEFLRQPVVQYKFIAPY
ncbi:MAG: signal peptide peptidase SppA [Ignavibacteriales bacterium]|nr:signal peptide peptidase SppA [Ignavibacteriales bacterium]